MVAIDIVAAPQMPGFLDYVVEAERLGARAVWVPEFWGFDALTPLGAVAVKTERILMGPGIAQLGTRTPAMLAMTAATLQSMSDGRFLLGIGTSGPQVMEGWHGQRFDKPVTRTRETIDIVRRVLSGERLRFDGDAYRLPLPDSQGKAIRFAGDPVDVPIYNAALGPRNLELTGARCEGWIGTAFLCRNANAFFEPMQRGAEAAGRSFADIDRTVAVSCEFTDDVDEAGRRHAAGFAFTIAAMGSARTNFYVDAYRRQGIDPDALDEVRRRWDAGDRDGAGEAVPIELGLESNLLGPPTEIRRRLAEYDAVGVDALRVGPIGTTPDQWLDNLGRLIDLTKE